MYSGEKCLIIPHFQGKKWSNESTQSSFSSSFSIRQLTFEALKAIEQANKQVQDSTLNKAKLSLNELITKSLASKSGAQNHLSPISEGKLKFPLKTASEVPIKDGSTGTNKERYKTELCRKFMENSSCPYGKKCQFAHGYHELRPILRHPRYRTELCREFFNHGLCTYGTRCNFIHQLPKEESPFISSETLLNSQIPSERPYTPSNDSGMSLSSYSPIESSGGRFSPIESTRISDRSESPNDLVAIQEIEE